MFARRGPGLVRAAATTAVVAGTAGAVRHRQDQKYARQDQEAYEQQFGVDPAHPREVNPIGLTEPLSDRRPWFGRGELP